MAISPVIPNCIEVRLLWIINGQGAVNVLHATAPAGTVVNQALANTLGAAIKTAFTTNLGTLMSGGSALARVGLRDLRTANQTEFLDTGAVTGGTGTGDPLPGSVAACATLRTALSGKSFRGRVYIGGFNETVNDSSGAASGASSTALVSFISAIQSAMTTSSLTMAVASRPAERYTIVKTTFHNDGSTTVKTLVNGNARAGAATPVTAVQVRSNSWESQRRRVNGRGAPPSLLTAVAEHTF